MKMAGHAKKCVDRYCELANKTTQQLYKVSTPCIDDHHFKEEETKSVGELSNTCSQIVLKCLCLARIGRPDILWSVNKFARSITKWTKACDKRLNRLISYIHHSCEYKWLQPGQRQKQNLNQENLLGRQQPYQYMKEDGLTLNHQDKILPRTIPRTKWSIFFDTIRSYIEKKMEQLNSTR